MQLQSSSDLKLALSQILDQIPYLRLLILFGSRARGDSKANSDWDLALLFDETLRQQYESDGGWNCYRSWIVLQQVLNLGDDEMDWIDLKDASNLLAHAIARDGVAIYESEPGLFKQFQQNALMTPEQLQAVRQQQKQEIASALQQWGL